jgi:hypothetical protein
LARIRRIARERVASLRSDAAHGGPSHHRWLPAGLSLRFRRHFDKRHTISAQTANTVNAWSPPAANIPAPALLLLLPALCYYAVLVTAAGTTGLFEPVSNGLTFNSMLLHLLQGRFDVDPAAIGVEGFPRNGAVYAYFGIFPALFRAVFLPLPDFATTDFTRLSCLVACFLMALSKCLSTLLVWRHAGESRRSLLLLLMLAVILVSGAQIQFLRPSIYQEPLLWSGAFASVFVLLVLWGWTREQGFTTGLMCAMATVAGLCLLTRVSTALGLYLALGFVWLFHVWHELRRPDHHARWRILMSWSLPIVVLLSFVAATAVVNQQRWGNPLVFAELSRQIITAQFPERLIRLQQFGEFNIIRLGYGLVYYFFPIWILNDGSGQLLWSDFVQRTLEVELPPSSFLISDPLIIGLALYGVFQLAHRNTVPRRAPLILCAIGLAVPIVLMLTAISMTFRYRMEFYPFLELCAFIGFWRLLAAPPRRIEIAFGAGALTSIVAAQALWLLYMLSPLGPADRVLGGMGVVDHYRMLLH